VLLTRGVLHAVQLAHVTALDVALAPNEVPAVGRPDPHWCVVLTVRNTLEGAATRSSLTWDLRALAYIPLAIFAALTLAIPNRRGNGVVAAVLGVAFVGAFVLVATGVPLIMMLGGPRVQAIEIGETSERVLRTIFSATAETSAIAPALLWLLARWIADATPQLSASIRSIGLRARAMRSGAISIRGARSRSDR
jgi:hypothetical protein